MVCGRVIVWFRIPATLKNSVDQFHREPVSCAAETSFVSSFYNVNLTKVLHYYYYIVIVNIASTSSQYCHWFHISVAC